jgi:trans-aconitate 2-methyltransferase
VVDADWDPDQYARFAAQRAEPFWDLIGLLAVDRPVERVADLGCGGGALTIELAARLGADRLVGIDSSAAMLAEATPREHPGVRFERGDIASFRDPGAYDIVFANASLQWVPDHAEVLERWTQSLRPGGQLAVQVPANANHPSHLVAAEIARTEPFLSALDGDPPPDPVAVNVQSPEWYARLLHELGYVEQHVRLQVYGHPMPSAAAVVEWVRGTSLTRFFKRLPADLHEPFVDAYRTALLERIGGAEPYFYPFKRILMWGASRYPSET